MSQLTEVQYKEREDLIFQAGKLAAQINGEARKLRETFMKVRNDIYTLYYNSSLPGVMELTQESKTFDDVTRNVAIYAAAAQSEVLSIKTAAERAAFFDVRIPCKARAAVH